MQQGAVSATAALFLYLDSHGTLTLWGTQTWTESTNYLQLVGILMGQLFFGKADMLLMLLYSLP